MLSLGTCGDDRYWRLYIDSTSSSSYAGTISFLDYTYIVAFSGGMAPSLRAGLGNPFDPGIEDQATASGHVVKQRVRGCSESFILRSLLASQVDTTTEWGRLKEVLRNLKGNPHPAWLTTDQWSHASSPTAYYCDILGVLEATINRADARGHGMITLRERPVW